MRLAIYATATHRHLEVLLFQMKPTSMRVETVVAVGNAIVLASNELPQVMVREVPLSVMVIQSVWPLIGVPDRLVVNEVMFVARAVIWYVS